MAIFAIPKTVSFYTFPLSRVIFWKKNHKHLIWAAQNDHTVDNRAGGGGQRMPGNNYADSGGGDLTSSIHLAIRLQIKVVRVTEHREGGTELGTEEGRYL